MTTCGNLVAFFYFCQKLRNTVQNFTLSYKMVEERAEKWSSGGSMI